MNSKKESAICKKIVFLLFAIILCATLAVCKNPAGPAPGPGLSTANTISNLTVDGSPATITGTSITVDLGSGVASAEVSFTKPGAATASFKTGMGAIIGDFMVPSDPNCSETVALSAGANYFIITITSESGSDRTYYLAINRGQEPVSSVTLSPHTLTLNTGASEPLTLTVAPANATNKNVTYASSDTAVATVAATYTDAVVTGLLVTAKGRGTATITVESVADPSKTDTATITVLSPDNVISGLKVGAANASGISPTFTAVVNNSVDKATISFNKPLGSTAEFRNTDTSTTVGSYTNKEVTVCSTDDVAFGLIGYNHFSITITSESGAVASYTLTIDRGAVKVTSISLSPNPLSLDAGGSSFMTTTVLPANATNKAVTWSSNDQTVATVDETTGLITGVARGSATITAAAAEDASKTGSATVTVKSIDNTINFLKVAGATADGSSPTFTASVDNSVASATITFDKPKGSTATLSGGSYNQSFPNIDNVECSAAGVPFGTPGGAHVYTITITSESGTPAAYTLTVTRGSQPVSSITLSPMTLVVGGSSNTMVPAILPNDATNKTVTWNSGTPAVATVSTGGVVSPVARGTTKITATAQDGSGKFGEATVTVVSDLNGISGLKVGATTLSGSSPFETNVVNSIADAVITFNKPLGAIASISKIGGGFTTANFNNRETTVCTPESNVPFSIGPNTFTITITSENNVPASYTLTVNRDKQLVTGITLSSKTSLTVPVGAMIELTADVQPATATDNTVTWSWSSIDGADVTVSGGWVTTKARGTAIITATANDGSGKSGSATVTVQSSANGMTGLTVDGTALSGSSPYYVSVENTVASQSISFDIPAYATASLKNNNNPGAPVDIPLNTSGNTCSVAAVSLIVGANDYLIIITSEGGTIANYNLRITRESVITTPTNTVDVLIDWKTGTSLLPQAPITITKGQKVYVQIQDPLISGPFTWYVDAAVEQEGISNLFIFDSTGRASGTYNIGVFARGFGGGDAVKVIVN